MLSRLYRRLPPGFINYQNFKIMTRKKIARMNVSILLTCLLVVFIISCNDSGNRADNSTSSVGKSEKSDTTQKPPKTLFLGDGKFAHLAIHKDSLEKFFFATGGLKSKKMVLRFSHDGYNASPIKIEGFLTKSSSINFLDRPPVILEQCTTLSSDLSGQKLYMSDLELQKDQYLELRKSMGNNLYLAFSPYIITTIPANSPYYLVLYSVTYHLTWISDCQAFAPPQAKITAYDPTSDLNPCPPNQPGQ